MGRFGHFLIGFIAGSVAMHYIPSDSRHGFWLIGLISICLAAELLYAFREVDKKLVEFFTSPGSDKLGWFDALRAEPIKVSSGSFDRIRETGEDL